MGALGSPPTLMGALGSPKCSHHTSRGECLLFRNQHECTWDVPTSVCTPRIACGDRSQDTCETELTTGAKAPWDATTNMCFWDAAQKNCRYSDECYGLTASACEAAACSVEKVCTPADMRELPGPNVCKSICAIPRSSSAPPGNASVLPANPPPPARHTAPAKGPRVETTGGTLRGVSAPSGGVESFLGVPFAESPIAELRWAPPKPISWSGTYEATAHGASCAQPQAYYATNESKCQGHTRGASGCAGYSESCLNLDVYTPSSASGSRAVMVWIHGGCFVSGSASEYDGGPLAAAHDVVVVVVQYRLGAFGWLGGDELRERDPHRGSTGNWGLLDNIAALKWIQANAAAFGGDPSRVTIFGESSGAGSVSQLLGIQAAWPYFHRAIMESGTASFWTYMPLENAQASFEAVAEKSGCGSSTGTAKVECLLSAASNGVADAITSAPCRDGCNWAPAVDGVLVPGRTLNLARAGQLRPNTPLISGFNLHDGAMFVPGYPASSYAMTSSTLDVYFSKRYGEERVSTLEGLFPAPGAFPGSPDLSKYFYSAQRCETDFSYACTALWLTSAVTAEKGSVWAYQFSEPTGPNGLSVHGAEIDYVFGTLAQPSAEQRRGSHDMMRYWANFAKAGDPNGASSIAASSADGAPANGPARAQLHWPAWDEAHGSVINLTATPSVVSVPPGSFVGCPFFDEHWAFYSGCLPPSS